MKNITVTFINTITATEETFKKYYQQMVDGGCYGNEEIPAFEEWLDNMVNGDDPWDFDELLDELYYNIKDCTYNLKYKIEDEEEE